MKNAFHVKLRKTSQNPSKVLRKLRSNYADWRIVLQTQIKGFIESSSSVVGSSSLTCPLIKRNGKLWRAQNSPKYDRSQKRQIARRQPRRIAIKFKNFFIVSASPQSVFDLFQQNFLLVREAKRAFACSVSSNGIICSRLAVKSVFLSFLCLLPAAFVRLRLGMVICAIPAILAMIRHSLIGSVFGRDSRFLGLVSVGALHWWSRAVISECLFSAP